MIGLVILFLCPASPHFHPLLTELCNQMFTKFAIATKCNCSINKWISWLYFYPSLTLCHCIPLQLLFLPYWLWLFPNHNLLWVADSRRLYTSFNCGFRMGVALGCCFKAAFVLFSAVPSVSGMALGCCFKVAFGRMHQGSIYASFNCTL